MEEELLEALIQRTVDSFFEDDISKIIASNALRKAASLTESVKSLEFLALKAMVAERRKVDNTSNVLIRLIFKEPLNTADVGHPYSNLFFCCQSRAGCQKLRNDPYVAYAIVEQYAGEFSISLVLTRTHLIIKNSGRPIATIPNRENQMFDTFWATRFLPLCLKIRCEVRLLVHDQELWYDVDYRRNILNSVIDTVNHVTPAEGWEKAIKKGELTIYRRIDKEFGTNTVFCPVKKNDFETPPPRYYAFQF